ncbi:MAG: hypothetical protein ABIP34_11465 [Rhodoferax sp.]|uniref:hypothetical protein n=1 Tax=Rhodoferax sp. TaxID=50421 RepID=UPI003265B245
MGPIDSFFHLLNFAAPALVVGVLVALAARIFMKNRPSAQRLPAQAAINFVVCLLVLFGGLWFFGHDGKMATYAALVLACATSQWWLSR